MTCPATSWVLIDHVQTSGYVVVEYVACPLAIVTHSPEVFLILTSISAVVEMFGFSKSLIFPECCSISCSTLLGFAYVHPIKYDYFDVFAVVLKQASNSFRNRLLEQG